MSASATSRIAFHRADTLADQNRLSSRAIRWAKACSPVSRASAIFRNSAGSEPFPARADSRNLPIWCATTRGGVEATVCSSSSSVPWLSALANRNPGT
ncbi:hypothetical protein [Streptomyces sp. HUAS TT20]|uniref:hypothetical protein n=1 Tax=Streptomyces sp. HUAS TT20 TaxID=3447509 RepID=UPI0021D8890E|nr:hypothetical protein [Streptomyces sp. HUAS 15-9]UXY27287.1 hypothetical protein N8I87_12260 [Streptomyces sp. HUAS 15-9]